MAKLIVGCGYLGERVAERWREGGHSVYVMTRSEKRAAALRDLGYTPIVADVTRAETLKQLPAADTVLFAVGFDRSAGNSIHDVYVDGLSNVLTALPSAPGRLSYISTTAG